MPDDPLLRTAAMVASRLRATGRRLVLAESCTGGLAAATLARIPGISEFFCGSAVVYRNATKAAWLGVPAEQLEDPAIGPVSSRTAEDMARGVLARTSEADLAAAVTGHLGPEAPDGLDGEIFLATADRAETDGVQVSVQHHTLERVGQTPEEVRQGRQRVAAQYLLAAVSDILGGERAVH
jgi:PncC family amidohydrolase